MEASGGSMRIQSQSRMWRPGLDSLTLITASPVTPFPKHSHEHFVVAVTEAGVCGNVYRDGLRFAGPGTLVVIHPGEIHTGFPAGKSAWAYRAAYPELSLLRELAGMDSNGVPFFREPVIHDSALAYEFLTAHHLLESPAELLQGQERLMRVLEQLATRYAHGRRESPLPPPSVAALRRARDYLESAYHRNVTVAELAKVADLSMFHFLRSFQRQFGLTPHAFLNQLRVGRAREMILRGTPIAQAASEVGFVDQAHLTRWFKRLLGVTPGRVKPVGTHRSSIT
jgi:AraC-like DNA-binding protein